MAEGDVMICDKCRREIPDGMNFCTQCGARVTAKTEEQGGSTKTEVLETSVEPSANQVVPAMSAVPSARRMPSKTSQSTSRRERTLLVVASVATTLALVAGIALVVVVFDPFNTSNNTQDETLVQGSDSDDQLDADQDSSEEDATDVVDSDAQGLADSSSVVSGELEENTSESGGSLEDDENDGDYVLPDSATHLYTTEELSDLSDWDLYIARNEIFARRGRMFKKDELQSYFDGQEWYEPRYTPEEFDSQVESLLNDIERANVSTILALEQERGSSYI